ncbi:MAG: serine/threonine-protein kinase, partial [Planctomycetota bacterium]
LLGYEMLAGRRPFEAKTLAELMYKHRFEDPESLDELCPDVPFALRVAVTRSIAKDREDRYPDMSAFLAALESCVIDDSEQEMTEPMPRQGSGGDPTLRVTTPARPTDAPSEGSEASGATYYPDFLKTPASSQAAADSAAQTGDSVARRRSVGRILLPGGVLVALATVVGLYFFGPLKPILQQGEVADPAVPAAVDPGATGSGPVDAGDAAPSDGEAVDDGVTTEPIVAQGEDADEASVEPPIAENRDESRDADAEDGGEQLAATENAHSEALAARQAAVTAGADVIFGTELAALDVRLREVDALLQSEEYGEATTAFSDLISEFAQLAARSSEAADQGAIQAVRARREMQQEHEAAIGAGARQRGQLQRGRDPVWAGRAGLCGVGGRGPRRRGSIVGNRRAGAHG